MSRSSLHTRRWSRLRRVILDRDNWRCRVCGKHGKMEVDHIRPVRNGGAEWDANNLQAICRACHMAKTANENGKPISPERLAWRRLVGDLDTLI